MLNIVFMKREDLVVDGAVLDQRSLISHNGFALVRLFSFTETLEFAFAIEDFDVLDLEIIDASNMHQLISIDAVPLEEADHL